MLRFLIFLTTLFVQSTVTHEVLVHLKNGPIIGFQRSFAGRSQNTFLGIPYAQPPTGDLRFKKPLPMTSWSEPIAAKEWPNNCPQIILPQYSKDYHNTNISEDCLYLNVFTKSNVDLSETLKPVLLFIPSVCLSCLSSTLITFDPIVFVDRNDVVFVTINFRQNVFGFLYTGTDEAPGNQGLYDQALAIEWVKDNIKYFGGDPEMITLFGQNSGSWSVGLHFLSPMTRNLFKNGMMMSGSPTADAVDGEGYAFVSREAAKSFTRKILKTIDCGTEITDDSIKCIKNMDFNSLFEKTALMALTRISWVITGDQFLHKTPNELLEAGDYKKNSQLIVGFTEDEGGTELNFYVPEWFDTKTVAENVTKELAIETIKKIKDAELINDNVDIKDVVKYYLSIIRDDDYPAIEKQLGILIGDAWLSCPLFDFARRIYEGDSNGSRVFGYFWAEKYPDTVADDWPVKMCEPQMGACQFLDLYPVFGHPFRPENRFTDRHRKVSDQMMQMLASFSKDGQPSPINGIEWPSFFSIKNKTMTPLYEFGPTDETSGFKYNINGLECDVIWKA